MRRIGVFLATCGGVGYLPIAPGTWGSAVGVAAFYAIRATGSLSIELGAIVVLFVLGIWSAGITERHLGRTDPGPVVLDEVVGMLMTLATLPVTPFGVLVGFAIFRVMDVIKPWPASRFEALPGGWGIMADDGMAGVYGHLVLRGLIVFGPAGWFA